MEKIEVEIRKIKEMSNYEKGIINRFRVKKWGEKQRKDVEKDYPKDTVFFYLKDNGKIVAITGLIPVRIFYLGVKYNILGICSGISIPEGKGYGRIMVACIISYLKKKKKSAIGFTGKTDTYTHIGFNSEKNFIRRFVYVHQKTGERIIDNDGDGVYYEGPDKFISTVLSTKGIVEIPLLHW